MKRVTRLGGLSAILLAIPAMPALAVDLTIDDGITGSWNNTFSDSSSWRTADRDPRLYTSGDGATIGLTGSKLGSAGNGADAGDLNYAAGDLISSKLTWLTEVELKGDSAGMLLRAKAWTDRVDPDRDVAYGNMSDNYAKNSLLSDSAFDALQKHDGAYLLDFYAYNTFDIAGHDLQVRVGQQALNWGESLFIQGLNQISPLDTSALRNPGTEVKEGLLPVPMIDANFSIGGGASVEGFWQFTSGHTSIDSCGAYWSVTETVISTTPGGCNAATIVTSAALPNDALAYAHGSYVPLVQGRDPQDGGNYGVSVKYEIAALDTELGLYGMNLSARTPVISGFSGFDLKLVSPSSPIMAPLAAQQAALGVRPLTAFWEYPGDIHLFGISAATNLFGWSIGSELSYSPNTPVQINGNDLLSGGLLGAGPMGAIARAATVPALGGAPGTYIPGYTRFEKTQYQINAVNTFANILGAEQAVVAGEAGFQWNDVPNYKDPNTIRYGRAFVFGTASANSYPTGNTCGAAPVANPSAEGCQNAGFVTDFAWGVRLRAQMQYSNIFDTGVTFFPSLSVSADLQGYSMDSQFIEGRRQYGFGARFNYMQRYNVALNYTTFNHDAKYDPLRDRDFATLTFSASF